MLSLSDIILTTEENNDISIVSLLSLKSNDKSFIKIYNHEEQKKENPSID